METRHFDFVVIGGGSAGYAAARTARETFGNVAIIEEADKLGSPSTPKKFKGKSKEGKAALEKAYQLAPKDINILKKLAGVNEIQKDIPRAEKLFFQFLIVAGGWARGGRWSWHLRRWRFRGLGPLFFRKPAGYFWQDHFCDDPVFLRACAQ